MGNHYIEGYEAQMGQFIICLGFYSETLNKTQAKNCLDESITLFVLCLVSLISEFNAL